MRRQNLEFARRHKEEHAITPIGYNATKWELPSWEANCFEQVTMRTEPRLFIRPIRRKRRKKRGLYVRREGDEGGGVM